MTADAADEAAMTNSEFNRCLVRRSYLSKV